LLKADDNYVSGIPVAAQHGHYVWVRFRPRTCDQSGAVLRQTGVIIDISCTQEIAESRQTDLIESFEPIRLASGGRHRRLEQGVPSSSTVTRAEALGQVSHKLLRTTHPIDPADLMMLLNTVRSWTGELQQRAKDGRRIFVESRQQAIEADGEILILETNHDITERKRAEADTARMAAVAAASQDALFEQ
jgi:PAS domain-containing protein